MFIFKLTEEELNIIVAGLGELPLKLAQQIYSNLQNQYREQVEASVKEE